MPESVVRGIPHERAAGAPRQDKSGSLAERTQQLAQVGGWEWEPASGRVAWTDGLYRILGVAPGAIAASFDSFRESVHPEDRDRVVEALRQALREHAFTPFTHRLRRPDGTVRWIYHEGRVELDAAGQPVRLSGFAQDITERRLALDTLPATQRDYEALVNAIDGIVWEADPATFEFSFVSPQAERMLGYPLSAWFAKPNIWLQRLHPDDRDGAVTFCSTETRAGRDHVFEYRMLAADGRVVWLQDRVTVLCEHGQPRRMRGVMFDITERKHGEALLPALLEAAPDAMVSVDASGRISVVNSQVEKLFGWSRSELLGQPVEVLIPGRFREAHERHRQGYFGSPRVRGMGVGLTLFGQRKDGSQFPVEVSLAPLQTPTGRVVTAAIRDASERQRVEAELAARAAALARSNEDLEQFAYVASHDLQEPLRTVASYSQLLQRRPDLDDARRRDYVMFITEGVHRMQELIQDLLAYSRVVRAVEPLVSFSLEDALADAIANVGNAIRETGARIRHDPLPAVSGNRRQLAQVFQNLLSNAMKFRGAAAPEIHIDASREAGEWVVRVRDNGIGVAPQHFDKMFVLFQRLHTRERYPGTGLGLAICKKVINRHGGRIWIESGGAGQGATFCFTLPAEPGTRLNGDADELNSGPAPN